MSFRDMKEFTELMRTLRYPSTIYMDSFQTPNFQLVADILYWMVQRYDPDHVDHVHTCIDTEQDRVDFMTGIVKLFQGHHHGSTMMCTATTGGVMGGAMSGTDVSGDGNRTDPTRSASAMDGTILSSTFMVKMNAKRLYAADGRAVKELLKVARVLVHALRMVESNIITCQQQQHRDSVGGFNSHLDSVEGTCGTGSSSSSTTSSSSSRKKRDDNDILLGEVNVNLDDIKLLRTLSTSVTESGAKLYQLLKVEMGTSGTLGTSGTSSRDSIGMGTGKGTVTGTGASMGMKASRENVSVFLDNVISSLEEEDNDEFLEGGGGGGGGYSTTITTSRTPTSGFESLEDEEMKTSMNTNANTNATHTTTTTTTTTYQNHKELIQVKETLMEQLEGLTNEQSIMEKEWKLVQSDCKDVQATVKKKKKELHRNKHRLRSLQSARPSFMDEFEKNEIELQKHYEMYMERYRNVHYLHSELRDLQQKEEERLVESKRHMKRLQSKILEEERRVFHGGGGGGGGGGGKGHDDDDDKDDKDHGDGKDKKHPTPSKSTRQNTNERVDDCIMSESKSLTMDDKSHDHSLLSSTNSRGTEDIFLDDLSIDKSRSSGRHTSVSPTNNSNDLSSQTDTTSSSYFLGSDKNDNSNSVDDSNNVDNDDSDDDDDSNF